MKVGDRIVKSIPMHADHVEYCIFVVYHCGDDWDRYQNYTATLTPVNSIHKGWI